MYGISTRIATIMKGKVKMVFSYNVTLRFSIMNIFLIIFLSLDHLTNKDEGI